MDIIKSLWFFMLTLSKSSELPIRACRGASRSIDLLGHSLIQTPAPTIEIVKSQCAKGYRLTGHMGFLSVKGEQVFGECRFLPREFSIHISFQHATPPIHYEYLVTLLAQDSRTTLLSVRYRRASIIFEYIREVDRLPGYIEFKTGILNDRAWHALIIAVAGNVVTMTIDCADRFTKDLETSGLSFSTDIRNTKFFIGSNNRKRKRFTGTVRKVAYVIGVDASSLSCLRRQQSSRSNMDERITETGLVNLYGRETPLRGNLSAQVHGCVKDHVSSCHLSRLDYLTEFRDIKTINYTIDIEKFYIEGVGNFLATANSGSVRRSKSAIYLWNGDTFEIFQRVMSKEARCWKHFMVGDEHFLALANEGGAKNGDVRSPIYRWNTRKKRFNRIQLLQTHSARSWAAFEIDGQSYLAVANYKDNRGNTRNLSEIFTWNKDIRKFLPYQKLPTNGATDVEFMEVELGKLKFRLLMFANTFDSRTTRLKSAIFYWDTGRFILKQNIETNGAVDIEAFKIEGYYFIAIANSVDDSHNSSRTFLLNSSIYKLDMYHGRFVKFQDITTNGAQDWEFFSVGSNHFLIISNLNNSRFVQTVLYKWQGVEKFVAIHTFTSKPTTDIEHITIGNDHYLAMADPQWFFTKLYKIVTY